VVSIRKWLKFSFRFIFDLLLQFLTVTVQHLFNSYIWKVIQKHDVFILPFQQYCSQMVGNSSVWNVITVAST
jgi:hypothetical protein